MHKKEKGKGAASAECPPMLLRPATTAVCAAKSRTAAHTAVGYMRVPGRRVKNLKLPF